jgi:hypothetical protein
MATNKFVDLCCLPVVDLPKFEVLKSFFFAYITDFDDLPMSRP